MTGKYSISDIFLNARPPLSPKNAVAAIIINEDNQVLLQLRDDKEEIFFPNHWGCFGGAIDGDETPYAALVREISEELGLAFDVNAIETFIKITFNAKPSAKNTVDRHFFLVRTDTAGIKGMQLQEGSDMRFFTWEEAMRLANISPYDKFGLWLYFNQARLEAS